MSYLEQLTQERKARLERMRGHSVRVAVVNEPIPAPAPAPVYHHRSYDWSGPLTIDRIMRFVCETYGISKEQMTCKSKLAKFLGPRQIAMFLALKMTPCTFAAVTRAFNRHHATVIHAYRKMEIRFKSDLEFAELIENLKGQIATNSKPVCGSHALVSGEFSQQELHLIQKLAASGLRPHKVAATLRRPYNSIYTRGIKMGLWTRVRKMEKSA